MFIVWNVFPDKLGWKKNFVIWGYSNQLCLNCHDLQACSGAQSCLTLCNPMDCSPPGTSVHGDSPGRTTGVGCHVLLQGILPTQGSKLSLPHWLRGFLLSHQGSWVMWVYACKTLTNIMKGYQHPCNGWGIILYIVANQYHQNSPPTLMIYIHHPPENKIQKVYML